MDQYVNSAKDIIDEGARVLEKLLTNSRESEKAALTAYDQVQQLLSGSLGTQYPTHRIEIQGKSHEENDAEFTWLVDVHNGAKRQQDSHLALGLVQHNQPIASVVYLPADKKVYAAQLYNGAWELKDGETAKITASKKEKIRGLKLCVDYGKFSEKDMSKISHAVSGTCIAEYSTFMRNMILLASGSVDAYCTSAPIETIELCIAGLIAKEAGVRINNLTGNEVPVLKNTPLPSNGLLASNKTLSLKFLLKKAKRILK